MKLVFVSGHDDDVFVAKALELGASGYVLKSDPLAEIEKAIAAAEKGDTYLSSELASRETSGAERFDQLTKREREILHYVSLGQSAKEIAQALKISTFTVTNHKANIMAKLGIHSQVGLTRFAIANGLASL
jgi:DNA-binding NarL/FixJ family response regulator